MLNAQEVNEERNNEEENRNSRYIYISIRGGFILIALIAIILNSVYGFALPNTHPNCIIDYSLIGTSNVNSYFQNDSLSKQALLIISSLLVDIIMVALGTFWILYGKSWRLIISLITFYACKVLIQLVFQEAVPDGYLFDYPGFPSIMISYAKTNDFFFSAPIGFLIISSLEFWKENNFYLLFLSLSVSILEIMTKIFLRGNYIIDIFSAIILAHFIFLLADDFCSVYLDNIHNEWFNLKAGEADIKGYDPIMNKYDDEINKD